MTALKDFLTGFWALNILLSMEKTLIWHVGRYWTFKSLYSKVKVERPQKVQQVCTTCYCFLSPNTSFKREPIKTRNRFKERAKAEWRVSLLQPTNWVLRACKPLLSYENISRSKIRGETPCYVRKVERWITPYSGPRDFFDRIKVVYMPARPN